MEFEGNFEVKAADKEVFSFLTDAEKMASIMKDVEDLKREEDGSYRVTLKVGISFIKGRFNLRIRTENLIEFSHAEITGSGNGSGSSVNFRGICDIVPLTDASSRIKWKAEVQIGGVVATMGNRLIKGSSERYIQELIESFRRALESRGGAVKTD